jgi:hypothetical protein
MALCAALLLGATPVLAGSLPSRAPSPGQAWVAKVIYPTVARSAPSTAARGLGVVSTVSPWGTPVVLLVLGAHVDAAGLPWVRVLLDYRPNGFATWIDAQDTVLHLDPWRISVSREGRQLRVYRGGHLRRVFAVVVGKPSTPTPAGLFAVVAELREPHPAEFLGSWVLPLTAHSDVLRHFDGGDGQVALHGRGGASLTDPLGSARSHGCVRLANEAIDWIASHVPVGMPVRVR